MGWTLDPTTALLLEWSAVALNIGFTILIALEKRIGWLLGLVAAFIGLVLYAVQDAWLMSALNGFYAAMGAYGWWSWGRGGGDGPIVRHTWARHVFFLGIGVVTTLLLSMVMASANVAGEYHDMEAFIAAFAILATWLMSEKALANWIYWMIGDVVAMVYNHLIGYDGYALLNGVYIVLAVVGFIRWGQQLRETRA